MLPANQNPDIIFHLNLTFIMDINMELFSEKKQEIYEIFAIIDFSL